MNFKSKWYSAENKPLDIPTFMDLQNVTGQVFDDFGNYIGQKELPKQQLILDERTQRQYYAPIEYDDDAIRYAKAKIDESFSPEDWYGMTRIKPHYKFGEHISAGYITALKSFAKPIAMLPSQLVYTGTVGLNYISQGNFESAENLYRFSMKNWEETLDKYGLGNDLELSDMFTAKVGSIAGQTASSLLIAAVVSSAGGLPAVASVFGSTQFADIMEESLAKGMSHDKAVKVAFLAALSEGGLEAVGFRMWSRAASLNKSFRNLTLAFLWEGAQEGSQQIGESAITNYYGVREQKLSEIVGDVMLSFLVGGIVGMGGAAISGQVEQRNIALRKEVGMNEQGQIVTPKAAEERKVAPKEGQVLNPSPEARKQLYANEIEEAKKTGENKLYNTIKYVANANGITDVNVIDKLYPVCSEMINDGAVLENLLDIIGQQVVAYKNQLESGQTDTKATQKAVEEIKLATDPNRYEEWKESRKSELEKAGMTKEQANTLSQHISSIVKNLSQRLGFDITEKKPVSFEPNLKEKAGTRGQITLGKTIAKIALNKNADPTTVEHEFFHYIDRVVLDAAKEGNVEAQKLVKKRDEIIKKAKAELKKQGIKDMPIDEEILASAYEKWLWQGGKSEDAYEQRLFNAIREFFREVYDTVKGLMGVRITPEADAYFRAMTGEVDKPLFSVFEPTQIKSVYNRGTFDTESPNIYYQSETNEQLYRNDQALKEGAKVLDKAPTNEQVENELENIRNQQVGDVVITKEGFGIGESIGDFVLTLRQRVGVIDKRLKYAFDKLDYNEKMMESEYGKRTLPFIKKYRKLSDVDKKVLKYLIGNQQTERIREFLREHDMEQEYNDVRNLLDELFEEGNRAGMDMGFLQEYFPTKVSDYKSFISYLMGTDKWSEIELALNQIDPNHQMSEEERADAINSILRGYNRLDPVGKKGFQKERKILHKTPEMLNYYMDVDEALMRYVSGMTSALAIRKAFNVKGAFNSEESIGGVVDELIRSGKITHKEEAFIKKMLKARLNYARTAPIVSLLKNFGYLGTMNNITSAVTQIGDLYAAFYKYNFPTAIKAIFGKSDITKDDLYLDSIWEEFSKDGFTSVAVNKLFAAIGLNAFDKFGKNAAINGAWIDLKERAKNNDVSLLEDLTAAFGSQSGKVLTDIKNNNITSEVKLMLWSQLADTQPIGKSGTPVGYLTNGYARILYQLKTYTVNQLSLFYADGLYKIQKGIATKNKKLFLQGTGNLMKLALLLTVFNAGADVLKNLIMGRSIEISDTLVSNLIWNLGVSKYTFYRGQRDGYARALFENFLPPQISMADEAYKDAKKIATGKKEVSDTIAVTYVPFGRMWYWWFGGGRTAEKKKGNKPFQVKL